MKKLLMGLMSLLLAIALSACNNEPTKENSNYNNQDENKTNDDSEDSSKDNKKSNANNSTNEENQSAESDTSEEKKDTYLNNFNSKEIEYARIWYQLRTSNYNVDTNIPLYVKNIRRGSKVNPQAENSAVYKEDVTTISSSHRAIGSITYSSNGDGTINLYKKVPYKWESPKVSDYSNMEEVTKSVIEEDVETIYVDPSDNQHVKNIAGNIKYTN
ncbi:hypothetical protein [Staphylococcus xylosus]|uniref:hypothetical protein n=1 Tax=Staphylococcus xylosus TaxID=1288 RepID=UPI000D1D1C0F|nr:hypothetical protein [Staphylococcus xylosus]PTH97963.1 hypothetical protein BU099_09565 [Staphylococcus xylosus]